MTLVLPDNEVLTTPCKPFDFQNPEVDPVQLAQELVKTMRDSNGIGLAANQIGYPFTVFSLRSDPNKVLFNPIIVNLSEEEIALEESCLTYPGLYVTIIRPRHARIRYTQPNGEVLTEQFTGMTARVVQHEMMHLEGKIFFEDLVTKTKLIMALKRAEKKGFNYAKYGLLKYART